MDRREFITSVGFAAMSGSAVGAFASNSRQPAEPTKAAQPSQPAPGASTPRTLRKAVMLGMVNDPAAKSTLDRFQLLRDCGFEGVEIDWPGGTPIEEFAAAQEKSGLKIHGIVDSLHWKHWLNHGSPAERQKGLAALIDCLRAGQQLGATSVLLVPGVVNGDNAYDDCWRLSQEQIRQAIPVAREIGVVIAVENVWNGFLLSPLEAARYVDELNPRTERVPPIAFHFDIGNVINFGWPHQWARILAKRIAKLHIKDFSRKKRDEQGLWKGFDVELGQGDAQWDKVMAALDQSGYSIDAKGNWATAEVHGGDRQRLKQIASQMDAIFQG